MDSKEIKKWALHHTLWHFTGGPLLDWIVEAWRPKVAFVLGSIAVSFLSIVTGVRWEWAVIIGCLTLAVALLVWDRRSARSNQRRKRADQNDSPSVPSRPYRWPEHFGLERLPTVNKSSVSEVYHNRLEMIFTNQSGHAVSLWTPVWESSEVPAQDPFCAALQLGSVGPHTGGWVQGSWEPEAQCLELKAGHTVMCWIGLLRPSGDGIEVRIPDKNNGTAIFPIKSEGALYTLSFKV